MIMRFLNEYSGALSVIITFVYALATFLIFWENQKSANASKELLIETKRQYDETKSRYENEERLRMMPYIAFDSGNEIHEYDIELRLSQGLFDVSRSLLKLTIKNIGGGTAKSISFMWWDFEGNETEIKFPIVNMQSGEEKKVHIYFFESDNQPDNLIARGRFAYQDLLERDYYQDVCFCFERNGKSLKCSQYGVEKPGYISKENNHA